MTRSLLFLVSQTIRDKAKKWIDNAPYGTLIEFREDKRTIPQNKFMWAALEDVSRQIILKGRRYDKTRWKVIFLDAFLGQETEFLPTWDGMHFIPFNPRSSELTKAQMSEFIEFILAEGSQRGVIFHDYPPEPTEDELTTAQS